MDFEFFPAAGSFEALAGEGGEGSLRTCGINVAIKESLRNLAVKTVQLYTDLF